MLVDEFDTGKLFFRKSIRKALNMLEDLQMIEAVGNYTGKKIGATFLEEQNQLMASG